MRRDEAEYVLTQLGSYKIIPQPRGFMTNCPLGSRHKKGRDSKPSMVVFDGDPTTCFCNSCHFGGKLFWLAKEAGASQSLLDFIDGAEGREVLSRAGTLPDYDSVPNYVRYGKKNVEEKGTKIYKKEGLKVDLSELTKEESIQFNAEIVQEWWKNEFPRYLINRKKPQISEKTYREWKMGHDKKGFEVEKKKDGKEYIVNFGPRVIFTILDTENRVVGWSGRTVYEEEKRVFYEQRDGKTVVKLRGNPKYYHAPGFQKSHYLYGMHKINRNVKTAIVVEGFLDVLNVAQCGFSNTFAIMGSSLSDFQTKFLIDNFERIILLPDGDPAGIDCVNKSFEILKQYKTVKIAGCIDGLDPGDYTREQMKTMISQRIKYFSKQEIGGTDECNQTT